MSSLPSVSWKGTEVTPTSDTHEHTPFCEAEKFCTFKLFPQLNGVYVNEKERTYNKKHNLMSSPFCGVCFIHAGTRASKSVCTATKGACDQIPKAQQQGSAQVAFVFINTLTDPMPAH